MIKLKIRYYNDQTDIRFPCTEKALQEALAEIDAEQVRPLELYVTEVVFPEELAFLQDRFVNLDEVNYLAKRMDSFFGNEEYQFYEAMKLEGFHWTGKDNALYLFEAPIDMLSFISLHKENWRSHSYAAACCVGDQVLFQMLKANPNIDTVCLCMDNDTAGQAANKRISDKLFIQGIKHEILVPEFKDWNEDLLCDEQEETECQTLQL